MNRVGRWVGHWVEKSHEQPVELTLWHMDGASIGVYPRKFETGRWKKLRDRASLHNMKVAQKARR